VQRFIQSIGNRCLTTGSAKFRYEIHLSCSGEEEKARTAGCDDFVPKPYSPRQLLAKIRLHLS
jgi:CheY-like chemotaxis protein